MSPEWYPGDKYVDIVSYDSYPSAGDYRPVSIPYDRALSLTNNRKLVTLSENGPIPDPDLLKTIISRGAGSLLGGTFSEEWQT